ncbi:GNAT family N-acetyltransferase [Streptomyces regalis]|uniref:GNAT family N-acetyltransferase n=1 Tax=Streptomyces regalis TaxID=68262 RepID=UPI003133B4A1
MVTTRHPERRTERLLLRQWRDIDLDPLAAMDADPEVMRYIGDGSLSSRERTAAALARVRCRSGSHPAGARRPRSVGGVAVGGSCSGRSRSGRRSWSSGWS